MPSRSPRHVCTIGWRPMNDRTRSGLRDSLLVIVGLIVVFVASVAVGSRISWLGEWLRDSPSIAGEVHNVPAVAVPAHRRLTPSMRALVNDILEDDETLLVVLNAEDLVGCEDLGRQLRRLGRAIKPRKMMLVTAATDHERVSHFLRRERVAGAVADIVSLQLAGDMDEHMIDGFTLVTPAAMVVDRHGRIVRGVMHPYKVKNYRAISFTEELGLLESDTLSIDIRNPHSPLDKERTSR